LAGTQIKELKWSVILTAGLHSNKENSIQEQKLLPQEIKYQSRPLHEHKDHLPLLSLYQERINDNNSL
jgi:hypothetical protein